MSKKRTDSSSLFTCGHAVEKDKSMETINTHNYYKTASEKWTDKKKTNLLCEFCKSV